MTRKTNTSGGAAAASGFGFQAHLGAIAAIHTLRGTPVSWTSGLTGAAPCAVSFETSGPGDDLALELTDREIVEIQAKTTLRANDRFWSAIDALCEGIHADRCKYGILIVCPNSSVPVRKGYALALRRIGEGRSDGASPEQVRLACRLTERGYNTKAVCARIRIRTVSALEDAGDAIEAAHAQLGHICADDTQVIPAWNVLSQDALSAIAGKGRRTVRDLHVRLRASQIGLADTVNSPVAISSRLLRWTMLRTEHFGVPGMSQRLPIDGAWLPLTALVREAPVEPASSVEEALADYRSLGEKSRTGGDKIDSSTIGAFRKLCVVVGGPGSGKSLLLRVLAREFAKDSFVSIRVRLRDLASQMEATGRTVEDGLLQLGLGGVDVSREELRAASLPDLVFLCDGLDECGNRQHDVASGLKDIAAANPSCRIVVATRPIGYNTSELCDWRHYDLLPLAEEHAAQHLETLCRCALEGNSESTEELVPRTRAYVKEGGPSRLLARSPLLLALGAAVILKQREPSRTKLELYDRIFDLIDPPPARHEVGYPSKAIRNNVLNHLGWLSAASPLLTAEELEKQCAQTLARALDMKYLRARTKVEACLRYWEEKGVIERLLYPGTDLIAFIHKTFGEYAAARHLSEMEPHKARQSMSDVLLRLDWEEVLDFSGTPLATPLAEVLFAEIEPSELDESELNRLVGILVRPEVSLCSEQRRSFVDRMSLLARSEDRRKAYPVGVSLTEHDLSRMPEAEEMATALVSAPQEWSRLVGWAVLACHFPSRVSREDLEDALRHFMERSHAKDFFVRDLSTFGFGRLPDGRVFENFMIGALKSLLADEDADYQDKLIAEVWQAPGRVSARFALRFEALLRDLGREDTPRAPWRSAGVFDASAFSGLDEIKAGWVAVLTEVVPPVFLDDDAGPPALTGLKGLGAFFGMAGISRAPVGDDSVWLSERAQLEGVHALLRAAAYVFELPADRLAVEARQVVAVVESLRRKEKWRALLLDVLPAVDAPEVDWSRAGDVEVDLEVLEGLVLHRSRWVQHLAALFLDAQLHGDERREACERILEASTGSALFLAGALTGDLPDGSELLIRRLEGRSVAGLHHLFDCLAEQRCRISTSHLAALENGLVNCGAKTAVSAARWCEATASSADTWLLDSLQSASSYWVENEEPYPKSSGAVPESPREALLRTRCMIAMPAFEELVELAGDPRPDVARAAIDGLVELATSSPAERLKLVEGILGKRFSTGQCETLLGSSVQYGEEELSLLCGLCGDSDPAFRSVAVRGVLGHPRMDRKKALSVGDSMKSDENGNVRDAVHRFLERGLKERS